MNLNCKGMKKNLLLLANALKQCKTNQLFRIMKFAFFVFVLADYSGTCGHNQVSECSSDTENGSDDAKGINGAGRTAN